MKVRARPVFTGNSKPDFANNSIMTAINVSLPRIAEAQAMP